MRSVMAMLAAVLWLSAFGGCKQPCFMNECDYNHYRQLGVPGDLDTNPQAGIVPSGGNVPTPSSVNDANREIRFISLAEAIAMGLEHGSPGNTSLNGTSSNDLLSFAFQTGATTPQVITPEYNMRVLALEPAIQGTSIEQSLSKFDVIWNANTSWITSDIGSALPLEVLQSKQAGAALQSNAADVSTGLLKPLPSGGVAGITFITQYQTNNTGEGLSPSYRPILQFQFEQPLLQGFGTEINELLAAHPQSFLTPFTTTTGAPGILIARINFDATRAQFEHFVQMLLANVEVAYWNLYSSYASMYAEEQALRQMYETWKVNDSRYRSGRVPEQDLEQSHGQYELFRARRLNALATVQQNEAQLRTLIGLPVEDGKRLVPTDVPTLTPFKPDWPSALNETLALRPELVMARQQVKLSQLSLIAVKNTLLPSLQFYSTYDINGIGQSLDGGASNSSNAFHSLAEDQFHDWTVGLQFSMPLGRRAAFANVRQARLNLSQSYLLLKDQEERAQSFLAQQYRAILQSYEQIQMSRSERLARALEVRGRLKEFSEGRGVLYLVLQAQQAWAMALEAEYTAIAQYNSSLARFEYAKGTIMQHDNVVISEAGLPVCAQVRAVEHERERTKAIVLRERAEPVVCPTYGGQGATLTDLPQLPSDRAPSVPALLEGEDKSPASTETAPAAAPPAAGIPASPSITSPADSAPGTGWHGESSPALEAQPSVPGIHHSTPSEPAGAGSLLQPITPAGTVSPPARFETLLTLPSLPPKDQSCAIEPSPGAAAQSPGSSSDSSVSKR